MNSLRSGVSALSLGCCSTLLRRRHLNRGPAHALLHRGYALRPISRCFSDNPQLHPSSYARRAEEPVQVAILGDAEENAGYDFIGRLAETQLNAKVEDSIKRSKKILFDYKLYRRERVAFHIKGYDIGRFGTIELVTLRFDKPLLDDDDPSEGVIDDGLPDCFILDAGQHVEENERAKRIKIIHRLLQKSTSLLKVVHNGAIAADAMQHILDVLTIDCVADTSSFHRVYSKVDETVSLQEAMEFAGFPPPPDSSQYDLTHSRILGQASIDGRNDSDMYPRSQTTSLVGPKTVECHEEMKQNCHVENKIGSIHKLAPTLGRDHSRRTRARH